MTGGRSLWSFSGGRFVACGLFSVVLLFAGAGCEPQPSETAATEPSTEDGDASKSVIEDDRPASGRSTVELTSATGVLNDGIVKFTINYRFTVGSPRGFYNVKILFPGTERAGVKPMDAGELKKEGTITTLIEVEDAPVDVFEITMEEADSPDQGFSRITPETLKGNVTRKEEAADGKK